MVGKLGEDRQTAENAQAPSLRNSHTMAGPLDAASSFTIAAI